MAWFRKKPAFCQTDKETWKQMWQSMVPPENRNVEITCEGKTVRAYLQMNHAVIMLQDGLLMKAGFFDVCEFFRRAGYHLIWLMRCTQDMERGYLKKGAVQGGRTKWHWKRPTTNFGRWTSDNLGATILLQTKELPEGALDLNARVLQRVIWAQSDDAEKMVPGRTDFYTDSTPGSASELLSWIRGVTLGSIRAEE